MIWLVLAGRSRQDNLELEGVYDIKMLFFEDFSIWYSLYYIPRGGRKVLWYTMGTPRVGALGSPYMI